MKKIKTFTTILLILFISGCFFSNETIYLTSSRAGKTQIYSQNQNPSAYPSKGYITVQKGDTVYGLSRKYNVGLRNLISTNNLRAPYKLTIGQKLRLPASNYHTVAKGDTVYSISRKYNVNMPSLVRGNNLKSPYTIGIGQKLWLPSSVVAKSTSYKKPTTSTTKSTSNTTRSKTTKKPAKKPVVYNAPNRSGFYFAWPIDGKIITPYGSVGKGMHNDGINIAGKPNQKVLASENGVVAYTGNEIAGYGNLLLIKHAEGWMSAYAHNEKILVKKGQKVTKKQPIAIVGKTGNVATHQLHFELRRDSKPINPISYLEKK